MNNNLENSQIETLPTVISMDRPIQTWRPCHMLCSKFAKRAPKICNVCAKSLNNRCALGRNPRSAGSATHGSHRATTHTFRVLERRHLKTRNSQCVFACVCGFVCAKHVYASPPACCRISGKHFHLNCCGRCSSIRAKRVRDGREVLTHPRSI